MSTARQRSTRTLRPAVRWPWWPRPAILVKGCRPLGSVALARCGPRCGGRGGPGLLYSAAGWPWWPCEFDFLGGSIGGGSGRTDHRRPRRGGRGGLVSSTSWAARLGVAAAERITAGRGGVCTRRCHKLVGSKAYARQLLPPWRVCSGQACAHAVVTNWWAPRHMPDSSYHRGVFAPARPVHTHPC